jgi:hypothetical protein
MLTKLFVNAQSVQHFSLKDGLLFYKGKVWLGNNKVAQQSVLSAFHSSVIGGHF